MSLKYQIERAINSDDSKELRRILKSNVNIIIPKLLKDPIKYNKNDMIDLLINYSSQTYETIDNKKHNALFYSIKYFNNYVFDKLIDNIDLLFVDIYNNSYLYWCI